MRPASCGITPEGWPTIGITALTALVFACLGWPVPAVLALALCYLFNDLARARPKGWKGWVLGLTGGSAALYIAFYPVLIGLTIPTWYSTLLRWLPSWPF